jgi:hypothetical protein
MKNGKSRFKYQLKKIEGLIVEVQKQENPALWLFIHDMRTPMFMLESLSKMYAKFHNENTFTKLNEDFKGIEDILGGIDYYVAFSREFAKDERIPANIKSFLETKVKEKIELLNAVLKKEGWLNGKKIEKIKKDFDKIDWLNEKDETQQIEKFYHTQIQKIQQFFTETNLPFVNIESQVHELRRKLRWLSIYPQALQGVVQLKEIEGEKEKLSKYLSVEIINSPFNQLPVSETLKSHLFLEKNHFLSLSWMIAELGKLKDTGLKINVLKDSFHETAFLKDKDALQSTYELLGNDYPKMETLLNQASAVAKRFFEDKILDSLVLGTTV